MRSHVVPCDSDADMSARNFSSVSLMYVVRLSTAEHRELYRTDALVFPDVALLLQGVLLVELVNRTLRLANSFLPFVLRGLIASFDLSGLLLPPFSIYDISKRLDE